VAIVAGLLGLAFAILHALGAPALLRSDRVPRWASAVWVVCVALTGVGSVVLLASAATAALAPLVAGIGGLLVCAIGNGYWLHGTPSWSHHAVRIPLGLFVVLAAVLAVS
jgi:hypothetical protein